MARDPEGFRWRTRSQIEEGRSWLWVEQGDDPLQGRGVGVDARRRSRSSRSGSIRRRATSGYAQRGMRDLCRLLLERVPTVCLFVRPENAPAIRVYEAIGMQRHGSYRSPDLLIASLRLAWLPVAGPLGRSAASLRMSQGHRPAHPNG